MNPVTRNCHTFFKKKTMGKCNNLPKSTIFGPIIKQKRKKCDNLGSCTIIIFPYKTLMHIFLHQEI